jgi:hypothetical protein
MFSTDKARMVCGSKQDFNEGKEVGRDIKETRNYDINKQSVVKRIR